MVPRTAAAAVTLVLGLAGGLYGGCGYGSTEWRPRNPKVDYPQKTKLASRVQEPEDVPCGEFIGVIHAEGSPSQVIPDAAHEAADHGGTHYVVKLDESASDYVTSGSGTSWGNTTFVNTRTSRVTTRHIAIHVYRDTCGR